MKVLLLLVAMVAALVVGVQSGHTARGTDLLCHGGFAQWPSGDPQAGVTVWLHDVQTGGNKYVTTDSDGIWQICGQTADTYTAQASYWSVHFGCYVFASKKLHGRLMNLHKLTFTRVIWVC